MLKRETGILRRSIKGWHSVILPCCGWYVAMVFVHSLPTSYKPDRPCQWFGAGVRLSQVASIIKANMNVL